MVTRCTTDDFWRQMCRPAFIRVSPHVGRIGATVYAVRVPPEHVPGFMQGIADSIYRDLQLYRLEKK